MNTKYEVNKIYQDEFGRVNGVFAIDKPEGKSSHDMVYEYRRKFNTKTVGHAGALDPFASGLLIILVGKATKLSNQFLEFDKEYVAEITFGIKTNTLDPEGEITDEKNVEINKTELEKVLQSFSPEYEQYVPVFSSVKVQGNKLRELARKYDFKITKENIIQFLQDSEIKKEMPLPKKLVKIYEIELLKLNKEMVEKYKKELYVATIKIRCSKGTYIRKLAEDVGTKLNSPAMLINLRRTKVGDIDVTQSFNSELP